VKKMSEKGKEEKPKKKSRIWSDPEVETEF